MLVTPRSTETIYFESHELPIILSRVEASTLSAGRWAPWEAIMSSNCSKNQQVNYH
jgi:hypothetical protein